jgi:putative DNA primase/helicase
MTDPVASFLTHLPDARQCGEHWEARCPAHDDQHASLSISRGQDGRVLLCCHAGCGAIAVVTALGLRMSALFPPRAGAPRPAKRRVSRPPSATATIYQIPAEAAEALARQLKAEHAGSWTYYRQGDDAEVLTVLRFNLPDGGKTFRPIHRTGGGWSLGDPPGLLPLYRLADLDGARRVYVLEGERCADAAARIGLQSTTSAHGAKSASKTDWTPLAGRDVEILPDADSAGEGYAVDVATILTRLDPPAKVRVVRLPGLPEGGDIVDFAGARDGRDAETLRREIEALADAAPPWTPPLTAPLPGPDGHVALGERDPASGRLVLSPKRTLPTARAYVRDFHTRPQGVTLCEYAECLMTWRGNRYQPFSDSSVRHDLQGWLHDALRPVQNRQTKEIELVPFESNPSTVDAALQSIKTYLHLDPDTPQPSWLGDPDDNDRPDAREVLPCRNMNLHIPTGRVLSVTPALFTPTALEFDYDAEAPEPRRWLQFLGELWGDDAESVALLQEWFGYCLIADTSQQKMCLLIGPRRSGKGTIGRVLARLIGAGNVTAPTTSSLAGPFGLQPLIGKTLAIVSDARFHGEHVPAATERLLCISGEDGITVDRKFMTSVTLKLPTRFMFLSNELPKLTEVSGALAGRFVLLRVNVSFYGQEDTGLTDKLLVELPGILKWALKGWTRLRTQGRFTQPMASREAENDLADLLSPVGAFIRERCSLLVGGRVWSDELYGAWQQWCQESGRQSVTTRQMFGRDLAAAAPSVKCRRSDASGHRFYEGISLLPPGAGAAVVTHSDAQ